MTLTLPVLQTGLSDVGRSPPTDKQHPSSLVFRNLSLPAHNLTDISLLASYPQLTVLNLSHNTLAAANTAATLSHLPHLTTLTLDHCGLHSFALSAPLSSLLTLSLSHNRLSELPSLALSPFVSSLDVSYNAFTSLTLSSLRYLQSLDASHNDILYLTADSLPSAALSHLRLSHNRLFTLTHVVPLPSLLTLDLTHNFFQSTASLAAIAPSSASAGTAPLHTVVLADNYVQSLSALSALPSLPHLRCLSLDGNSVSRAAHYRADVLYLLPRLCTLDGVAVGVEAVTASEEAAGDDDERRAAVWHDRLPSGHATRKWQVDEEEKSQLATKQGRPALLQSQQQPTTQAEEKTEAQPSDSAGQPNSDGQSHERHVRTFLPEQRYWQLMSERGLVHPWTTLHQRLTAAVAAGGRELLDVSYTALGECGVRALAHWLAVGEGAAGVRVLDLTAALDARRVSSRLSNEYGFGYLLDALPSTAIYSLSLSRCRLTDQQCELLAAHLASPSCRVEHVDLSFNLLGSHLRRGDVVIEQCPSLVRLLSAVAASASTSPLLSLNLSHNSIDQHGCTTLARFLSSTTCHLTLLSLDANPLTAAGLSLLSHSLHTNTSLVELTLRHLPPSTLTATTSLPHLSAALARFNRCIRTVDLTGTELHDVQAAGTVVAEAVAEIVEGRGRIDGEGMQELRMKGIKLTSDAMAAVGRALKGNTGLRVLQVGAAASIEPLTANSLVSLCDGIASSMLVELDVSAYSATIDSNATAATLSALLSHRTLRHVSLPQLSYSSELLSDARQQLVTAWQAVSGQWQRASLRGSGQPLSEVDEAMLLAILPASSTLSTLYLSSLVIPDSFITAFVAALSSLPSLSSLSLLSCQLSSTALSSLLAGLPVGLRELDLSRSMVGPFSYVLPRASQLSCLTLSHCGITSLSSAALSPLLALPCLASLRLSDNPLSAASLTSLATLIAKQSHSCPLRVLDVSGCALSDGESSLQSLCALVRAAGRSLHELHLPSVEWLDGQQADGDSSVVLTRLLHSLTSAAASGKGRLRRLVLPPSLPLLSCHQRQLLALAQQGSQPALEWVGVQPAVEGEDEPVASVADGSETSLDDDSIFNSVAAACTHAKCVNRSQ